jgi:cysteine synthase
MYFKNAIEALGHTPLVEIPQMVNNKKVHILAKLEGQNLGGSASTKDRIAKYMIDVAEKSGELTKDKTIIEATSGNTGISLAWLGKKKGYNVTIVMPENMSKERQQLIKVFGAELILTKAKDGVLGSIALVKEIVSKDKKYFMPDQFANPANPLAHYKKIDIFVGGIGTGGTIVGVTRRLREKFPKMQTIGIEPPPGDCVQGLRCLEDYVPPVLDLKLINKRFYVTSQQANDAAKNLLNKEGIFCGQSSGAMIHQAVKIANEMDEGNIITILPDGGWKYISMDFWTK